MDRTEYDMIDGLRSGSCDEWSHFYRTFAPLIRMHGRDCGVPVSELDDLVQNVMTEFFRNGIYAYDSARGRFRTYLRQVIRTRSADLLRKLYRERRKCEAYPRENEYLDRRYDEEWVEYMRTEALRRLRYRVAADRYRQFCMLAVNQRDVKSVARSFGVTPSTIYSSFGRTREVLHEIVRELETTGE